MASYNVNELTTRSGKSPDRDKLPYSFTTTEVESYFQDKVNVVLHRMAKDNPDYPLKDVEVRIYTTEAGKNFLPFVIVLPTDVLNRKRGKNSDVDPIFNQSSEDGSANLRPEFYNFFKSYVYTKDDEAAFFSDDWRRARRVDRSTSSFLKQFRTPKVTTIDNNKVQVVAFMLDPLRVFHDMLTIEGDNRSFKVDISSWQKIQSGEFRYDLKRLISKGKHGKKNGHNIADELNRKFRGGR